VAGDAGSWRPIGLNSQVFGISNPHAAGKRGGTLAVRFEDAIMTETTTADPNTIFDLDHYQRHGYPHAAWARLRDEDPIHWCEDDIFGAFWAVTRYEDIVAIERDSRTFISGAGVVMSERPQADTAAFAAAVPMILMMDPPKHGKYRGAVRDRFTPPKMKDLEAHILAKCREIVDGVAQKHVDAAAQGAEADFVTTVAARLPMDVILELLGVPTDDRDQMFIWSNAVVGNRDSEYGDANAPTEAIIKARTGLFGYFAKHVAARRANPRNDFVSVLVDTRIDGEPLTDHEILGYCFLLAIAGNETTRNATSGALLALLDHPDAMRELAADDALMPTAVDELLRWVAPIVYMRRTASIDVEMHGKSIKAGDRLALFYPSANRDERVFSRPLHFDIRRTPNEHLTFGFGRHRCLGNDLARMELGAVIGQVIRRFPDIHVAGPVERLRSNFVGGIKHLPVRFA
jgi:cytochrome P450